MGDRYQRRLASLMREETSEAVDDVEQLQMEPVASSSNGSVGSSKKKVKFDLAKELGLKSHVKSAKDD